MFHNKHTGEKESGGRKSVVSFGWWLRCDLLIPTTDVQTFVWISGREDTNTHQVHNYYIR